MDFSQDTQTPGAILTPEIKSEFYVAEDTAKANGLTTASEIDDPVNDTGTKEPGPEVHSVFQMPLEPNHPAAYAVPLTSNMTICSAEPFPFNVTASGPTQLTNQVVPSGEVLPETVFGVGVEGTVEDSVAMLFDMVNQQQALITDLLTRIEQFNKRSSQKI